MTYRGHMENGVVVLDDPGDLPDGTEVEIHVVAEKPEMSSLARMLMKYAGKAKGLPKDLARNHDHYLHGVPKR